MVDMRRLLLALLVLAGTAGAVDARLLFQHFTGGTVVLTKTSYSVAGSPVYSVAGAPSSSIAGFP